MSLFRKFLSKTDAFWVGICLLLGVFFGMNEWIRSWDLKALDLNFRLHRLVQARPAPKPEIVLVGLDEESARRIPEPLALYHRPLGLFCEAMAQARPSAVGVDVILPEHSWDLLAPSSDAALMRGILLLRRSVPLVLGRTAGANGIPRPIHAPFETAAGLDHFAFVQVVPDGDRTVRRFETRLGGDGAPVPTFAGRLAQVFGQNPRPGLVDFSLGTTFDYVPFYQVLAWQERGQGEALQKAFAGKIVLLGSVISYEDRVMLPIRLAAWEHPSTKDSPAVTLQAQILRTLLSRAIIAPLPPWVVVLLAVLGALGGMSLAKLPLKAAWPLGLPHLMLPAASYCLLGMHVFLPFAGLLAALDVAYLLTAQREGRRRIQAEAMERRFLERSLLETAERERRSIGHELHDGVCQQITGALLRCRVAERSLGAREVPEVAHLQVMADLLDSSLGEAHALAQGLSPGDLEPGALGAALTELARRTRERFEVACEFTEDGSGAAVDGPATTQLYRIAQEAVNNALKHAAPQGVWIGLHREDGRILLSVEDDGRGLGSGQPTGMGQRIMRYRAELIGGVISLGPRPGGGTRLVCAAPLDGDLEEGSPISQ